MFEIDKIIHAGHENMRLKNYKDGFCDVPNAVFYDELSKSNVSGVLKGNFYVDGRLKQVYSNDNQHTVVVAGTGLGKTTQYVIPTIKSCANQKVKKSLVISDPKGEVYNECSGDLAVNGYKILRLDFRDPLNSECWNPLTPIFRLYQSAFKIRSHVSRVETPGGIAYTFMGKVYNDMQSVNDAVDRQQRLILEDVGNEIDRLALIIATPTGSADDKMWEDGARDIFKAFMWGMLEDSRDESRNVPMPISEDTYSFSTMITIANTLSGDRDASICAYDKGYFSRRRQATSKAYYYAANTIVGPAPSTRASFMSVFNTQISPFKDTAIKLITCCNSFDFGDLLDGPVAIFINYRDEVKTNYAVISLFVQDLYIYLIKEANKRANGKLEVPWYFVLDEFGNFPRMRDFETVISACRGRNIYFSLVIQSYAQLEGVYGKNTAEIIKDNLNVHIFIGSNNYDTLEAFSRECGKVTRVAPLSALNGDSELMNLYQLETIPLLPVSTLAHLEEGECVVTEANTGEVLWSKLERYYKCKEFERIPYDRSERANRADPLDKKYNYKYVGATRV